MPGDARVVRGTARTRLLDAAIDVIRTQGYSATTVDDLCAAAGVTKGAFFHHFASKGALGVAVASHWATTTGNVFAAADFHDRDTATGRILGYVELRRSLIGDDPAAYSCLAGTMVQETFDSDPDLRRACADAILGHAATLEQDLEAALTDAARADGITAAGAATHIQAVLQGAFVVSKAAADPSVVTDSLDHLRRYLITILHNPRPTQDTS